MPLAFGDQCFSRARLVGGSPSCRSPSPRPSLETQAGNKPVKCTATAGGISKDFTATLVVEKPTIDYQAWQDTVRWLDPQNKTKFGLYPAVTKKEGMEFLANVKVPQGYQPGKWQFVQTTVNLRYRTLAAGGKKEHC
ncbi:MAG: hypothetical protein L0Y71_09625 [Gemmataceae bacterium]|nr:hypothetical protein [Gemmataceae bacterium]